MCHQQVRRGRYKNEVDVAVKMMKEGTMQEADFIDEAKTMMYLLTTLLFLNCQCTIRVRTIVPSYYHIGQSCSDYPLLILADSLFDGMTLSTDYFQAELDMIFLHR